MIKLMELIDQTIANRDLYKQEKPWKKFNKATDKGKDVLVVLKKDKKKHYVYQHGNSDIIMITNLDGNKVLNVKPTKIHQIVLLPHSGYVRKHPELKKYGFR